MELSKRVKHLPSSGTVRLFDQITDLIAEQKKNGLKPGDLRIITFTAGQSDLPTPEDVKKAGIKAIRDDKTRYTQVKGTPSLVEAVITEFNGRTGLNYTLANATTGNGVKEELFLGFGALINSGDCVLVFRPCWTSYPAVIEFWGGVVCYYDITPDCDFSGLERVLAENKVKGVVINSPNNPAGYVLSKKQLACLAEKFKHVDWIFSDEVYKEIVFGENRHYSIVQFPGMATKTIVFDGVSKSHSMTGWRIGYAIGPEHIITGITKFKGQASSCACSISQEAATAGLSLASVKKEVREMAAIYEQRLNKYVQPFADQMAQQFGVVYYPVHGTFYLFIQIPTNWKKDCTGFCAKLLQEKKVGLVPGIEFKMPGWIRISFAASEADLKEGLERIIAFCAQ